MRSIQMILGRSMAWGENYNYSYIFWSFPDLVVRKNGWSYICAQVPGSLFHNFTRRRRKAQKVIHHHLPRILKSSRWSHQIIFLFLIFRNIIIRASSYMYDKEAFPNCVLLCKGAGELMRDWGFKIPLPFGFPPSQRGPLFERYYYI